MHACTTVYSALGRLTNLDYSSDDVQHIIIIIIIIIIVIVIMTEYY